MSIDNRYLTLKEVRVILALAGFRNGIAAAGSLNMSQPVLSRALKRAEAKLRFPLFQRGWSGAEPTLQGDIAIGECREIITQLEKTARAILGGRSEHLRLTSRLSWNQLEVLTAVVECGSVSSAANRLAISQPSASKTIRQLCDVTGLELFTRTTNGLRPLADAHKLAGLWHKVEQILSKLGRLVNAPIDGLAGRVAVGMLPFSGQSLVAKAFGRLSQEHPNLRLVAVPGSYDSLVRALRRNEIDVIVGILRNPPPGRDLIECPLYEESFTLIARRTHTCHHVALTIVDLTGLKWIVAPHGTPVRAYFDRLFQNVGAEPPIQTCEMLSFESAEQMLVESSSVGLLTYSQFHLGNLRPALKRVEFALPESSVPIGLTRRTGDTAQEPLQMFEKHMRHCIAELGLGGDYEPAANAIA